MVDISPQLVLRAYAVGIFPMAESAASDRIYWFDPEMRGIMPLESFHVPRRLARTLRQGPFTVTADEAFEAVMRGCAEPADGREQTWINQRIVDTYCNLFEQGHGHSIEVWREGDLVGGLYGVALGGAFFGESMFSRVRDASKVALVHTAARLVESGFTLFDTQFVTDHLKQFGAVEIPQSLYRMWLGQAIESRVRFQPELSPSALDRFLHSTSQTS